jgi:hypothetical protein
MNRKFTGGSITYGVNLVNELVKLDSFNSYVIYVNKDCKDLPLFLGSNFNHFKKNFDSREIAVNILSLKSMD